MRNKIIPLFIFTVSSALLFGAFVSAEKFTVKGSDTLVILAQRWAERYMSKRSDVAIQVTGA